VVVLSSGTEGLYATLQALVDPGDEVICFQPFFPWYLPAIRLAGGTVKTVTLDPAQNFAPDMEALKAAFSSKTKLIITNTPHNPTGHISTLEELEVIAELCREHDVVCLSDEVYEPFVFGESRHNRICDLPGMAGRTLTLGSGGKLFSCTGWRVGWIYGPAELVGAVKAIHGYCTFSAPTPFQEGIATALDEACDGGELDDHFSRLTKQFGQNAATLCEALATVDVQGFMPDGGYFLVADVAKTGKSDIEFCKWLASERDVTCVPLSVFYEEGAAPRSLVRFAICKSAETIEKAAAAIAGGGKLK